MHSKATVWYRRFPLVGGVGSPDCADEEDLRGGSRSHEGSGAEDTEERAVKMSDNDNDTDAARRQHHEMKPDFCSFFM